MKEKDLLILSNIRLNSRIALTKLNKLTKIPISTLSDNLKNYDKFIIKRYTTLIDFEMIGYNSKTLIILKSAIETRLLVKDYLSLHDNVNNFYITNSGYDFLIETIFRNQRETQLFLEDLEKNFKIEEIKTFNIIEDVHREKFLTK